MQTDSISPELMLTAFWIFLFGIVLVSVYLRVWAAILIVGVKVLVSFVYFWLNPEGFWQLKDDQVYFFMGKVLEAAGYSPFRILVDPQGILFMKYIAASESIAYYWWNFFVMNLLGFEYSSVIFSNIGSTFISGYFFCRILVFSGFSRQYAAMGGAFFLLHWDIIAWSSFVNLKDNLVLMLTLASWDSALRLLDKFRFRNLLVLLPCLFLLSFFRFYLPTLIAGMLIGAFVMRTEGWKRYLFLLVGAVTVLIAVMPKIDSFSVYFNIFGLPMGFVRFLVTPQPWSVGEAYSFLILPATFHWLLLIPSLVAAKALWKESPAARTILMYGLFLVLFYAGVPEVQGPRHRYQIVFVMIWMQFHFFVMVYRKLQKSYAPNLSEISGVRLND